MTGATRSPAISRRRFRFSTPQSRAASLATYGTMAHDILSGAADANDLGMHFGGGLYEREVEHLIRNEWAVSADDILWRRTKLGLRMSEARARPALRVALAREAAAASSAA